MILFLGSILILVLLIAIPEGESQGKMALIYCYTCGEQILDGKLYIRVKGTMGPGQPEIDFFSHKECMKENNFGIQEWNNDRPK